MYLLDSFPVGKNFCCFPALAFFVASFLFSGAVSSKEQKTPRDQFSGPLKVTFLEDGQHVELNETLIFYDANGKAWTAWQGMTSDGATIPGVGWPIVGPPLRGPYVRAAVVHDQYCYSRTEPSDDVHKMFRDAMIVDKVPSWKVTFMYGAVLLKGPKWDETTVENARKLFKQNYYDGDKGFRECLKNGDRNCSNKLAPNYMPRLENYATPSSAYEICKKAQCSWTELKQFEDQWMYKHSGVEATELTEEEVEILLKQAKEAPGDFKEMEELVARKLQDYQHPHNTYEPPPAQ